MSTVIKVENISKQYRLGLIGTNTLKGDLNVGGTPAGTTRSNIMIGQWKYFVCRKRTANERPEELFGR